MTVGKSLIFLVGKRTYQISFFMKERSKQTLRFFGGRFPPRPIDARNNRSAVGALMALTDTGK